MVTVAKRVSVSKALIDSFIRFTKNGLAVKKITVNARMKDENTKSNITIGYIRCKTILNCGSLSLMPRFYYTVLGSEKNDISSKRCKYIYKN